MLMFDAFIPYGGSTIARSNTLSGISRMAGKQSVLCKMILMRLPQQASKTDLLTLIPQNQIRQTVKEEERSTDNQDYDNLF